MPLTLAVDQIQPVSAGSKYLDWQGVPTGMPVAINVISYNIRTGLSNGANVTVVGGSFTKLRNDTTIRATCTVFGAGFYSGNCGVGLVIDYGSVNTYGLPNARWDFGLAYQYDGAWISAQQTTLIMGHCQWTGISAGAHTMSFGWNPADNTSSNKPFSYLCPNTNDDVRNQQMVSRIVVYEVAP